MPEVIFNIEKSTNGNNFETIARNISTVSSQLLNYSWVDNNPNKKAYYRIKKVKANGGFIYSNICTSKCQSSFTNIQIYPNPINDIIHVDLGDEYDEEIIYKLNDALGRVILSEVIEPNTISFDVQIGSNIAKGLYLFVLHTNSEIIYTKTLKK